MFRSLAKPRIVLTRMCSPSKSHQTTDVCGSPRGDPGWTGPRPAGTRRGRDARRGCGPSCRAIGPARAPRCRSPRQGTRDPRPNLPALQGWGAARWSCRPRRHSHPTREVARAGRPLRSWSDGPCPGGEGRAVGPRTSRPNVAVPATRGSARNVRARPAGSPLGWGCDRDPVHVPCLRRRDRRRGRSGARDPWRPRVRRRGPARRRGRGPRPLVERELQGRPGDDRRTGRSPGSTRSSRGSTWPARSSPRRIRRSRPAMSPGPRL